MTKPDIIEVRHLLPELYSELIQLLRNLSPEEWNHPTSSSKWNVKDIAAHLLDGDLRRISFQRDNLNPPSLVKPIENYQQLIDHLNHLNNSWIEVSRRLSPGVLIDLLSYTSIEIPKLFNSFDMNDYALFSVSWAGEEKSKNWFDIAREYTEKWYHQQQIREAVGKPILSEEKWLFPLLDTFVRGLPNTFQKVIPEIKGAIVVLEIKDILHGIWTLKNNHQWELFTGGTLDFTSKVILSADTAWRMFSKNVSKEEAKRNILIKGDKELGMVILELTTYMK